MIRKAGGMRLGAWSGAAESPYATGDYRKQQRDGDAAVGGLDLTRCGRYDSTGPKNNGKLSMCLKNVFLLYIFLWTGERKARDGYDSRKSACLALFGCQTECQALVLERNGHS